MSIPFDQIERTEYVEIGGLVLATPAWECVDSSALYDAPPVRGDDIVVPYHEGALSFRRIVAPRRVVLPMVVYGDVDREGNEYEDARVGLRTNLDDLKRELARPAQVGNGTRLLRHIFKDGEIRQAPCVVIPPLGTGPLGPTSVRCTVDLVIPGGLLRSPDVQAADSPLLAAGTHQFYAPNSGTADQFEAVLSLDGTATSVTVKNLTWDPSGATWVRYSASVGPGITIDTAAWTVLAGVANAIGALEHAGHERWLPLAPGPNLLEVVVVGGNAQVGISHYPAWL